MDIGQCCVYGGNNADYTTKAASNTSGENNKTTVQLCGTILKSFDKICLQLEVVKFDFLDALLTRMTNLPWRCQVRQGQLGLDMRVE